MADSEHVCLCTYIDIGKFLCLCGLLWSIGFEVNYDEVAVFVGDQALQFLSVVEQLYISDVAANLLEPHLPENVSFNPLADKKAQASILIGQEHIAGFV